MDGRPFAPLVAPLGSLNAKQSVETQLVWPIPIDTTTVSLRGLGTRGSQAEKSFVVPAMPAMPGE